MSTQVEIEVDVDLEAVIPCEHVLHIQNHKDEPAKYLVRQYRTCCEGDSKLAWVCHDGMVRAKLLGLRCPMCGYVGELEEFWTVVKTL